MYSEGDQTKYTHKKGVPCMYDFNTELAKVLVEKKPLEEFFRQHLENAINGLLESELSAFLGYEKHDVAGWNSGNSRNGSYQRTFDTQYGTLNLTIPRDRKGEFHQQLIPKHQRRDDVLEETVIHLYRNGVTTREIGELIERMYGHHYSPQTISNITEAVEEQVNKFHNRPVSDKYAVIYCDATYLNVRRDSVAKEALHVLLGITPDGQKEVLDYGLYPTESSANYAEMLHKLQARGLKEVLLFVSDGLIGLPDAVRSVFPKARHQSCWVHLSRTVCRMVRNKDRKEILDDLKKVYTQETAEEARAELERFLDKHSKKYPKLRGVFQNTDSLYSFYAFPKSIRSSIYTSNMIENNNKGLKHKTKTKEQFPNESSLERFICGYYSEYNRKVSGKAHKGFKEAEAELLAMFDQTDAPAM